jgi:uncharacterized protein YjbJ (UPF0337 family)
LFLASQEHNAFQAVRLAPRFCGCDRRKTMANKDQVKGAARQAKGAVKEAAGKAAGSRRTEAEGRTEKVAGKAQKSAGDVKSKLK